MNIRWLLIDHPDSVRLKKKNPKVHKEIKQFSDLTDEDKAICLRIKGKVNEVLPDAKVFLFGSRINGRWTNDSDYDIAVQWLAQPAQREALKYFDYGVKVDLKFTHKVDDKKMVLI